MKLIHSSIGVDEKDMQTAAQSLLPYIKHLQDVMQKNGYDANEASINLSFDNALLANVHEVKHQMVTPRLKYIIDIGIGGSNLGTKAVYDAFFGYYDILQPQRFPKMIFLDTNEEGFLAKLLALIETIQTPDELLINAISKSGGTTETIANLEIVLEALEKQFGEKAKERLVITTDEGSKLHQQAKEKNIAVLTIPKLVGGRYSVLSAVGLFPLDCCNINIGAVREGAQEMVRHCTSENLSENPALSSAIILFLLSKQGKTINDNFFFDPQLESLGKWYRQLMGESIGKEHDTNGTVVHAGITPTVSLGSTDLHSVGQLYLGGPRDKITTIVYSEHNKYTATVPATLEFPLVSNIENKRASEIMMAIREGVKVAYQKQGLPFMEVVLDSVDEKPLGEYLQFKMIEMMYLGKLLNINTFDQPHVELYKVETKRILSK